jgi:O-antigen ligase
VESLWELRDVFLFAAPFVTYLAFRDNDTRRLGLRAFGLGVLGAVLIGMWETWGAIQTGAFPVEYRPDGTLGHYMTYAGAMMLAVPLLLIVREGWVGVWHRVLAAAALMLIGLTMTRSAWIGCLVGYSVYFLCRFVRGTGPVATRRRGGRVFAGVALTVAIVLAATLLLSLAGPELLYERGASIFSLDNPTNLDRLAMAATGLRIIGAHPLIGIGPGLMERVYPAWRVEWAVKESNPHLHNDLLQIAAERGLLGLATWIWLMVAIAVGAWRVLRYAGAFAPGGAEARAALGCLAAFLTMGLFEYNFSDSEVLAILLFAVTLPFAASDDLGRQDGNGTLP